MGINRMKLNQTISHDTLLSELASKPGGPALREAAEKWMCEQIEAGANGSAFDLSVDCAYDMGLVPCPIYSVINGEDTWDIPQYLTELAEELMGADV